MENATAVALVSILVVVAASIIVTDWREIMGMFNKKKTKETESANPPTPQAQAQEPEREEGTVRIKVNSSQFESMQQYKQYTIGQLIEGEAIILDDAIKSKSMGILSVEKREFIIMTKDITADQAQEIKDDLLELMEKYKIMMQELVTLTRSTKVFISPLGAKK